MAEENTVRLFEGRGPYEGWVQIYQFGHWGCVCGNSWDMLVAAVVCRELGKSTVLAATSIRSDNFYDLPCTTTWKYSIHCTGYEENIKQCSRMDVDSCTQGHALLNCTGKVTQ